MKRLLFIFLSLFMLTGCTNIIDNIEEVEETDDIELSVSELQVFDDVYLKDIINNKGNVEIDSENTLIDTETIGEKSYDILYEKDNKKYSYTIKVNVVDKEAPRVFGGTNKSVTVGYTEDICNLVAFGDNYDGYVNCVIDGEYDLNRVGTYKLVYKLSDSSDNVKEVNVTLNVTNPSNGSSNNSTSTRKTPFVDVLSKYKDDNNEIGIDVSKWQGDIDFNKVKNAGATFVMMRIGVQTAAKGELSVDRYYKQNIKNAKEAGLKVGVYLYSIAVSKEDAVSHAKWVLDTLDGETLDLPIVFDWENWSKWNTYKISFHEINATKDAFIKTVKDAGYEGMLYSSKFYLENIWENKYDYPVWLAHYTDKTSYTGKYIMWQLSNTGRIDGINGDVDIDILYNNN